MVDTPLLSTRLGACRNAGEIRALLAEECADLAEVLNVTALCNLNRAGTLCVVDFIPGTKRLGEVAERIGGKVFGLSSVVIDLELHAEFTCPKGFTTPPPACACTLRK